MTSRSDATLTLIRLCLEAGADHYMILQVPPAPTACTAKVVASNWSYDTIEIVGVDLLGRLAASSLATFSGRAPHALQPAAAELTDGLFSAEEAATLAQLGHAELFCLRLNAGQRRYFAILSSAVPGKMRAEAVSAAQLNCCYLLSEMSPLLEPAETPSLLSERERECLSWAAEGKTTDEIALILNVSNNTINGYIQQAIRKLSVPNRAKAIATAIRSGLV